MFVKKVLLKNNKFPERQLFEETLRLTIGAEYDIKYTEKYIYLEIYDFEDSFSKINVVLDVFNNDFSTNLTMLIVPKFDDFMLKLLDHINGNGVYNAYQILNSLLIKGILNKEEIPNYLEKIDKELLQIFTIYFETGQNICLTSRLLYLHRNTLNYKISKLSEELNMDIRDNLIANFLYLILKII